MSGPEPIFYCSKQHLVNEQGDFLIKALPNVQGEEGKQYISTEKLRELAVHEQQIRKFNSLCRSKPSNCNVFGNALETISQLYSANSNALDLRLVDILKKMSAYLNVLKNAPIETVTDFALNETLYENFYSYLWQANAIFTVFIFSPNCEPDFYQRTKTLFGNLVKEFEKVRTAKYAEELNMLVEYSNAFKSAETLERTAFLVKYLESEKVDIERQKTTLRKNLGNYFLLICISGQIFYDSGLAVRDDDKESYGTLRAYSNPGEKLGPFTAYIAGMKRLVKALHFDSSAVKIKLHEVITKRQN